MRVCALRKPAFQRGCGKVSSARGLWRAAGFGGDGTGLWVSLDSGINTGFLEKRVGTSNSEAAMSLLVEQKRPRLP